MSKKIRSCLLPVLFVALLSLNLAPRADAQVSQAVMALAGPLAQQFGVPSTAVTKLLESDLSLESVTQLLLVSKKSSSSLDSVTKLFNESGKDIGKTAAQLDVGPKAYSEKKVTKTINKAKKKAQAAAVDTATDGADAAVDSASESASSAVDSAVGGLER